MKKSELIAKLQAIPGDPEVAILDYLTNMNHDYGEGSSAAIYTDFEVEFKGKGEIPDGAVPWIALSFENEFMKVEEDEERTCRECGCTDDDCRQCYEKTGLPCHWVEDDLCSACAKPTSSHSLFVKSTDKFFYDSPDSGHPDCKCSRCAKTIPENESPILRMWPTEPGDHGYDPKAEGGTEFRYCWSCSKEMGVDFGEPQNDFYEDM